VEQQQEKERAIPSVEDSKNCEAKREEEEEGNGKIKGLDDKG